MLIDPRCIILTLAFVLAGCTTKATSPNQAQQRSASDEETSWHCEQGTSTWSCKRLTIAEIQQREADRREVSMIGLRRLPSPPTAAERVVALRGRRRRCGRAGVAAVLCRSIAQRHDYDR